MTPVTTDGFVANRMYDNIAYSGVGAGNGSFASPSANAVRINAGNRANEVGFESLNDQNQFASTNKNIIDGCNRTTDSITNMEFRSLDRQRDIEKLVVDGQKEAAACCCDAKLEACKNTAEIKALVIQENSKTRELIQSDALEQARAKITQLETINALKS